MEAGTDPETQIVAKVNWHKGFKTFFNSQQLGAGVKKQSDQQVKQG